MKQVEQIVALLTERGVVRPRDLRERGLSVASLYWLHRNGRVMRTGRGLYYLPGADLTEHHTLAEAARRVPHGVICLLSALSFHNLGTQLPFEVWLAVDRKARRPQVDYPPLRIVRFSGQALTEGVEEHLVEGVTIRVFCPAKTVADCFKYRNKIGLDVAVEALRECRSERKCSEADLWRYARICRVANVLRPYLEATARL
jgi:predicted transcriptional regulator of viral defense system